MNECIICAETFNQSNSKEIKCPYCNFTACMKCCKTYIISKEQTTCMNVNKLPNNDYECQREWSRKFMVNNFPKIWININWKNMLAKVGVEKEKALLPATMPELDRIKREQQMHESIQKINIEINKLQREQNKIRRDYNISQSSNLPGSERNYRGRPCEDSNCRGFLSTQWKCGVCDFWTCHECHQLKGISRDSHHVCNPDEVATAKLLNNDTKPCPSCSTPIFKLVGCDQMWCTQCHTGFSWKTGIIQNNHIHNPHYFEWQRNNNGGIAPRNAGDVECGRDLLDSRALMSIRSLLRAINEDEVREYEKIFENYVRSIIHLDRVQAPRFRVNNIQNNQDIRIRYLQKEINSDQFSASILRRSKCNEKKQDIFNVIQLEIRTVTDIIYRFESELKNLDVTSAIGKLQKKQNTKKMCDKYIEEINNITKYSNDLLKDHANTYNCKLYTLDLQINRPHRHIMNVLA